MEMQSKGNSKGRKCTRQTRVAHGEYPAGRGSGFLGNHGKVDVYNLPRPEKGDEGGKPERGEQGPACKEEQS